MSPYRFSIGLGDDGAAPRQARQPPRDGGVSLPALPPPQEEQAGVAGGGGGGGDGWSVPTVLTTRPTAIVTDQEEKRWWFLGGVCVGVYVCVIYPDIPASCRFVQQLQHFPNGTGVAATPWSSGTRRSFSQNNDINSLSFHVCDPNTHILKHQRVMMSNLFHGGGFNQPVFHLSVSQRLQAAAGKNRIPCPKTSETMSIFSSF